MGGDEREGMARNREDEDDGMAKFMAASKITSDIDLDKWLKLSYILPTDNTQPRLPKPVPLRKMQHAKKKEVVSFDRLDQAVEVYINGVCNSTVPMFVKPCKYGHPPSAAWWWRGRCDDCHRVWKERLDHVISNPTYSAHLKKLQKRVPDSFENPSERPNSPFASKGATGSTKRIKKREGIQGAKFVAKFPYNHGRKGSDTNLDTFTGPLMQNRRMWLNAMARGVPDPIYFREDKRFGELGGLSWMTKPPEGRVSWK